MLYLRNFKSFKNPFNGAFLHPSEFATKPDLNMNSVNSQVNISNEYEFAISVLCGYFSVMWRVCGANALVYNNRIQ